MIFNDMQTCCFMHLIRQFVADKNNYLLPVNCHSDVKEDKVLLGYYDDEYIYFISSVIIGKCDTLLMQHKLECFNMQKILNNLFRMHLIKVHWVLSGEVRYRPQKRIGKTRKRYITFIRREIDLLKSERTL